MAPKKIIWRLSLFLIGANGSLLNFFCLEPWLRLLTTEQHNPDVITTHFMDDRFVNLGEEVILTLLWQSGASESATVCFVISLSIPQMQSFACRVCVRERAREREREKVTSQRRVCVWERETRSHNRGLLTNTYEHHHCVCHATVPLSGLNWW